MMHPPCPPWAKKWGGGRAPPRPPAPKPMPVQVHGLNHIGDSPVLNHFSFACPVKHRAQKVCGYLSSCGTVDLGGMGRTEGCLHKVEVGVETTAVMATRELSVSLLLPGWHLVSE